MAEEPQVQENLKVSDHMTTEESNFDVHYWWTNPL